MPQFVGTQEVHRCDYPDNYNDKIEHPSVLGSLLFATAYFALATAVIMGVALAFFGAEGGDLPVQVLGLGIPYDLTMAEATWTAVGLGYLMTLGLAGLTLLLSSKLRSQLAIFAVCAALVVSLWSSMAAPPGCSPRSTGPPPASTPGAR